jgi:hypothetical protein
MPILFLVQVAIVAAILRICGISNSTIGAIVLSLLGDTSGDIIGAITSLFATPIVGIPVGITTGVATIIAAKKRLG